MEAYLGQIEIFAFNFAPRNWALCRGQLMAINQNQALFAVIGTTFGGDGMRTFALPNLQGLVTMGQGNGAGLTPRIVGQTGGEPNHTLLISETPVHTHSVATAARPATTSLDAPATNTVLATTSGAGGGSGFVVNLYVADPSPNVPMDPSTLSAIGGQPHANQMPSLGMNFCISLSGLFPSRP
jgi:microcystin-dependent protein